MKTTYANQVQRYTFKDPSYPEYKIIKELQIIIR